MSQAEKKVLVIADSITVSDAACRGIIQERYRGDD